MHETKKSLLQILSRGKSPYVPIWLMRQAGRYLPEYRELRKQTDGFINFCLSPALAATATMQPLKRFNLDAAILFADILLIPHALGQRVEFEEGKGPRLDPIEDRTGIKALFYQKDSLDPVYETIQRVKNDLSKKQTLIGFCGGPWTVACYMIEGKGKIDFSKAKHAAQSHPAFLESLTEKIAEASLSYLLGQIKAGAEVIQIFESHAGQLEGDHFESFVIQPTKRLISAVRAIHPGFPVIGFPRGASLEDYQKYMKQTGVSCCGMDQSVPLSFAQKKLKPLGCLQGNLSPEILLQGGDAMLEQAQRILEALGDKLIFNLGHGVIKETPPEHIAALVDFVHKWKRA